MSQSPGAITIQYKASRAEINKQYWRMWKSHLWKKHVIIIMLLAVIFYRRQWPIQYFLPVVAIIAAWLLAYPQLMYKPQLRSLTVDEKGLQTSIGLKSGIVNWSDILWVEESGSYIYIVRKNLNSFIIPRRAFESEQQRTEFLSAILKWHEPHNVNV